MNVQLLYFDGCPHWTVMDERLREALALCGRSETIEYRLVETPEAAEESRFTGSPSIRLDGRDPFPPASSGFGLTCRVYRTPRGPEGAPTVAQLQAAVQAAAQV